MSPSVISRTQINFNSEAFSARKRSTQVSAGKTSAGLSVVQKYEPSPQVMETLNNSGITAAFSG